MELVWKCLMASVEWYGTDDAVELVWKCSMASVEWYGTGAAVATYGCAQFDYTDTRATQREDTMKGSFLRTVDTSIQVCGPLPAVCVCVCVCVCVVAVL